MPAKYVGKLLKMNHMNPLYQMNISRLTTEIARYLAPTFELQLADCNPMPKTKIMGIQNMLIALMMISIFTRQETIIGQRPTTLRFNPDKRPRAPCSTHRPTN
jgi:hypothetical protein